MSFLAGTPSALSETSDFNHGCYQLMYRGMRVQRSPWPDEVLRQIHKKGD